MHIIRSFFAVSLCWVGLAVGADIAMTARQSQALGIETVPLATASSAAGIAQPAQVVIPNPQIRVVSAPLPGLVESLAVAVNQGVRKGQPLARLQSPGLAELQRDYLQAALQAQLAQNSLSRDEKLFKEGIIAESRYLTTRNAAQSTAASAAERRQALRLAGIGDATISKLQAGEAIGSTLEIGSPIEGVVLEQMVAPGQRVEAAAPLFKVARLSPLWLEIQVPLSQASALQAGAAVRVAGSLRDSGITGKVISIGRGVAEGSQTVLVRAEVTEGAAGLRPGQFVEAVVGASAGAGQWTVPASALVRVGNQAYVFVQAPAGYRPQPVKVLGQTPSAITISGALRGDERIVSKGGATLKAAWQGLGQGGE